MDEIILQHIYVSELGGKGLISIYFSFSISQYSTGPYVVFG